MLRNDNELHLVTIGLSATQARAWRPVGGGVRNVIDAKKKDATLPATANQTSENFDLTTHTMTATSTPTACTDEQPALYRLAHQSRWSSSSDLTGLHDRLAYLFSLHSSPTSTQAASTQVPTSGSGSAGENVHVENNQDMPSSSSKSITCTECPARKRALSELHYTDVHTHRTALHILCYWRPRLHLVSQFLGMAPHMVWSRSSSGETALHLACSNATRMAGADVIELLLCAAETMTGDTDDANAEPKAQRRRRRYALLTDERGYTAVHCAVQADAPKSVLEVLLKAAPEAAILGGGYSANEMTPIDLLYQTYELFIDQYLDCETQHGENNSEDNEPSDDTNDGNTANSSIRPDILCHFWDKLTILLRAGCQALQESSCGDLPILHATLILLSSRQLQLSPSLLGYIMKKCIDKETYVVDGNGCYALHYGAQALALDALDFATVRRILEANPNAARIRNIEGFYPLQLLLENNGVNSSSYIRLIQDMARACPDAIFGTSGYSDELAPHIIGMLCRENDQDKASQQICGGVDNAFNVLRTEPSLINHILNRD